MGNTYIMFFIQVNLVDQKGEMVPYWSQHWSICVCCWYIEMLVIWFYIFHRKVNVEWWKMLTTPVINIISSIWRFFRTIKIHLGYQSWWYYIASRCIYHFFISLHLSFHVICSTNYSMEVGWILDIPDFTKYISWFIQPTTRV